jgi:hypothetical protein
VPFHRIVRLLRNGLQKTNMVGVAWCLLQG